MKQVLYLMVDEFDVLMLYGFSLDKSKIDMLAHRLPFVGRTCVDPSQLHLLENMTEEQSMKIQKYENTKL